MKFKIMDIIAPVPEYLKYFTMINQTIQKIKDRGHEIIDNKPKKEATPLPPLNFSQIGNMCPITEKKPLIDAASAPNITKIKKLIKKVFRKSNNRVINPSFLPKSLLTFVAPILPEPYFLISSLFLNLKIKKPNGIDPTK